MKIGILTFHCAYNFGAVLQCYALYSFLHLYNYDVEVVNYCPSYLETKGRTRWRWKTFLNRNPFWAIKRTRIETKRDRIYTSFISKNMSLSERCDSQETYNNVIKKYDVVIIGSDQVWNTAYNGKDPIWYGFGIEDKQKLLAYAVSAGDPKFTSIELDELKQTLYNFSAISVREECLSNVITPLTSQVVNTVLDPSLMAPPEIWEQWLPSKKKYIVVYQARINNNVFRIAESLSRKSGYPIIAIDNYANSINSGYHKVISPDCFISLIKNSYCVITTSFHGTAFSIIMNTPFYTLRLRDGADARNESILKILGAEERMIDPDIIIEDVNMDFTQINIKLEKLRKESQHFLLKNL